MPDLYEDIKEKPVVQTQAEIDFISKLMEYMDEKHSPWRKELIETLKKCYDFVEGRQWETMDEAVLEAYGVPKIPIDRVDRGLQTIRGMRENTGHKKKFEKRELGDERAAKLLDLVGDYVEYHNDFEDTREEAFGDMLVTGMGVRKLGFDPSASGGEGEIFAEHVPVEDFWFSKCKSKSLDDIRWSVQRSVLDWEEAAAKWPARASEILGLKTLLATEWEENKDKKPAPSGSLSNDYGSKGGETKTNKYPDQVDIYEIWKLRVFPVKKVGYIQPTPINTPLGTINLPTPQVKLEKPDYVVAEGEQELATTSIEQWWQYIVVGSNKHGIIVSQAASQDPFHPYVGMCAEKTKSGRPRGYVEKIIPHQIRINIAWAQKVAFNNKSIKSPLIVRNVTNMDRLLYQSSIGVILNLQGSEGVENINVTPNVNLQAIEEGEMARRDMDFAAAATEEPLRGGSNSNTSGIKFSLQQSAAVTPLNIWVKAEKRSELSFWRKVLHHIITKYPPQRMQRIVGAETYLALAGPVIGQDEAGKPMIVQPPLDMDISLVNYDVTITDQAVSDFNKQQSFNAIEALAAGGVLFTQEFRIKSAPIKNIDDALASNQKAQMDMIMMLQMQNQMLQEELDATQKMVPKDGKKAEGSKSPGQTRNAQTGKSAPQNGQRSMLGGSGTKSVV